MPPFPPLIVPLLVRLVIVPAFDTPAPPAPPLAQSRLPPPPPLIVPLLVSGRDRAGVRYPGAARAAGAAESAAPPFPPLIVPLLVSVVIVPEFDDPRVEQAPLAKPAPPLIVAPVAFVSEPIVAPLAFDTPAPPANPARPLIGPLLVSVVIVPAFDTPAPPVPATCCQAVSAADRAAVGQRRDRPGVRQPAPPAPSPPPFPPLIVPCWSAS